MQPIYPSSSSSCSSSSGFESVPPEDSDEQDIVNHPNLEFPDGNSEEKIDENDETDPNIDPTLLTSFELTTERASNVCQPVSSLSAASQRSQHSNSDPTRKSLINLLSPSQQHMIRHAPITTYHRNMVRQFPGAENRTPEEKEKRRKNTEAARQSRHTAKQIGEQIEQNEIYIASINDEIRLEIAAKIVRVRELYELLGLPPFDFDEEWAAHLNSTNVDATTSEESDE